jgi:hypothetical protein
MLFEYPIGACCFLDLLLSDLFFYFLPGKRLDIVTDNFKIMKTASSQFCAVIGSDERGRSPLRDIFFK